jgi:polar amino acid transport system substrate-binding protein
VSAAPTAVARDLAPTGTLRAAINLGNPVLAQGTAAAPGGATVDIARELAARLGVALAPVCVDAARKAFAALTQGDADIAFLAVEPAREAEVAFTPPYVLIEGVFVVPDKSGIATLADVDRAAVRIGVKQGSAYDLFLTRTLQHATLVRADEGVDAYLDLGLEAGAGIRQPVAAFVERTPGQRMLPERFMEIRQAVATTRDRTAATTGYLHEFVEELKASGFVAEALRRAGQTGAAVAPPATPA